ncbi:MAG TPA: serine/threonine-protein kinase, partial [Polyangiaceae bacterium]|nr:serine/threonine-protein kinase [Polyangiaceae bacterium]
MEGPLTGKSLGAGAYRVGSLLGQGAMGAVYDGVQEALGRAVAIKVLHAAHGQLRQDQFTRFQREARAAAALGHANIIQITDFQWQPGEPPFLVMEKLVGQSLGDAIQRGRLRPQRVAFIASQVLSALAAAHAAGIVHRDIKPDNVFLTVMSMVNDIVKVLDFGVAKLLDEAPLTMAGAMVGSPAYMPPEQALGAGVDARADLYAVGATMYHALSGRLPIQASDVGEFLARLEQPVTPLSQLVEGIDPGLEQLVARAMSKRPEARFASADEMRLALRPWAQPHGSSSQELLAHVPSRASAPPDPRATGSHAPVGPGPGPGFGVGTGSHAPGGPR